MADEVVMPKLSDSMEEGKIIKWRKNEGDKIRAGEIIVEVESDKAVMEVEAFVSGKLLKIVHHDNDVVKINEVIAFIGSESESAAAPEPSKTPPVSAPSPPPSVVKTEATLKASEAPTCLSPFAAPSTGEKVIASPAAKRVAKEQGVDLSKVNGTGPGGRIIERDVAKIHTDTSQINQQLELPKSVSTISASPSKEKAEIEPLAKVLMDKHGIKPDQLHGTGSNGRITITDVNAVLRVPEPPPNVKDPTIDLPPIKFSPSEADVEEVSFYEQAAARRVTASKHVIPHFYLTTAVDLTALLKEKEARKQEFNATLTHLLIVAAARMIEKYPRANWSFEHGIFIKWKKINIGIAIKAEAGLVVAVLKDTGVKDLRQIISETRELVERARVGKLKPEERANPGFTISNLGMYDVDSFSAIINPPSACTLAVASAAKTPVVKNGEVVIIDQLKLTLSSDHRVVDGVYAAEIMVELKRLLENPNLIFPARP